MTDIKKATAAELKALEALAAGIWHEHYDKLLGAAQVDYMLDKFQSAEAMAQSMREGCSIYAVYEEGELCGYLSICPHEDHMYLSKLYLSSGFRRRGIGRKMMEFVENEAKNAGFDKVRLNVNKHNSSITPYKHLGFETVYAEVIDIGSGYVMDDYVMEKRV